jgi:hypothetical protein
MKRLTVKLFILLLTVASCNENKNKQITVPQIDIDSSVYVLNLDTITENEQRMKLSSIFSKVKTIILETTKESVIGRVQSLQVFDDRIFIMDNRAQGTVLMFDINGKFIHKIGNLGAGPGEYMYATDFTIDPVKKEIYILYSNFHINRYTIDGKFINKISFKSEPLHYAWHIQYHSGKIYTDMSSFTESPENEYLLQEIDPETGKQTGQFLNLAEYNNGWSEPYFSSSDCGFVAKLSESPKFLHLFTHVIPELNKNSVKPAIVLQSKHLATRSDVEKTKGEKDASARMRALKKSKKITLDYTHYAETKNHIFFMCPRMDEKNPLCWIMIDRQTKSVKIMRPPFNDLVFIDPSKEKSVLIPNTVPRIVRSTIPKYACSTSEGVYEYVEFDYPISLFQTFKSGENLNPNLDKLEELKKLPEDTNPVIFYYSYE